VFTSGVLIKINRHINPKKNDAKTKDIKFKKRSFVDSFISLYDKDFLS
jgi:hypothetical protein